ncbi:MAG: twin-arginine translocase TatA/TatE family subunit [Bacteroidales bacterium]|nr:twin-arginine translocase TatA/TatE family subunit [Bacteroidales bacterium]
MTLLFFDFGTGEIILIVLAIFLVFGPKKIPELARSLGKVVHEIKKATEEVKTEINREADRQEREDKLKKYKEQVSSQENSTTEQQEGKKDEEKKQTDDSTNKS